MSNPPAAHADCPSGISGDMFLAALIDAGLPLAVLREELGRLDLEGYRLSAHTSTRQAGIKATGITVEVTGEPQPRTWLDIRELIEKSRLAPAVKDQALAIFATLAQAEAAVHGCLAEEVHFHEVGAVDSIVDVVGAAIGLSYFQINELTASPLPMPSQGWTASAHGPLPLPAPAVCELVRGLPVYGVEVAQELVTPTGAAILKVLAVGFGPLPAMTVERVGYGAGSNLRADGRPNLLRIMIGRRQDLPEAQVVTVIETSLDDWSPETFPHVSDRLFDAGALDVYLLPIQMKKGRPGFRLEVIAPPATAQGVAGRLLAETSAIGLRLREERRITLPRVLGTVATELGPVRAKLATAPQGPRLTPEYEDCRRLALASGLPIGEIYRAVLRQPEASFTPDPPENIAPAGRQGAGP